MWAPPVPGDSIMSFNNTPPPVVQQHNSGQFNFNNRGHPQQMQRGYPYSNMVPGNQQHKMTGGAAMVFGPPSMPLDVMNMSMPPPSHNSNNPHIG